MVNLFILVIVVFGSCLRAVADDCSVTASSEGRVYKVGNQVSAPVVAHGIPMQSTEQSRLAKFEGDVTVQVVVDAHGKVEQAFSLSPIGMGLDEEVIKAAKQFTYKPSLLDGCKPVPVTTQITFHLKDGR
jgi:protein TonB